MLQGEVQVRLGSKVATDVVRDRIAQDKVAPGQSAVLDLEVVGSDTPRTEPSLGVGVEYGRILEIADVCVIGLLR